jgi:hypothetical protein
VTAAAVTIGTDIPGILWEAGQAAITHETCTRCGAEPGQPCATEGYTDLCRFIAAFMGGHLEHGQIAAVMAARRGDGILIPTLGGES